MGQHSCEKERKFVTNKQTKLKSEQLGCFEIVLLLKNILKISWPSTVVDGEYLAADFPPFFCLFPLL